MTTDIDQPPIYDELTKSDGHLSDIWFDWWSTFWQTLSGYLTQFGLLPPQLTTEQRDSIQSPQNGQMIYNITIDSMQYFKVSTNTWISF